MGAPRILKSAFVALSLACACFLGMVPVAFAAPKTAVVQKIRLTEEGSGKNARTRVVLELSAPTKPRVFTLESPHRVVVDMPNVQVPDATLKAKIPATSGITALRAAENKPGTQRLVLEMADAATASAFVIAARRNAPFRVVVDVRSAHTRPTLTAAPDKKKTKQKQYIEGDAPPSLSATKPTPHAPLKPLLIVLDAGHGGHDPGSHGLRKTQEKHIVLQVAKRLRDKLEAIPGVKVAMTRDKDKFVSLDDRVKFGVHHKADMFISLHADAHHDRSVKGGSIYVLSQRASDREAARLAKDANTDMLEGLNLGNQQKEVRNILIDLVQRDTMNRSVQFGQTVLEELDDVIKLRKSKVLFAGFVVLKGPEIPSILIEMAYLSNPAEEKLLNSTSHQNKMANAIAAGVRQYIKNHIRQSQ
ncbi:MAG: N-acetylmuramoyl-L-alanine amidase [Alphaproteobacteria bacterium]